uniref:DUF3256 family protein n=1 Tax=Panagrellus redivivus TaxID=6233 RepID=A0A7E4VZM0_PANRE
MRLCILIVLIGLSLCFAKSDDDTVKHVISVVDKVPENVRNQPDKFIVSRNAITGETFVEDLTVIGEPTPARRVRVMFTTSMATSATNSIQVFHMKVRWIDPDRWNDNFTETGRAYNLLCEIEDEDSHQARTFLALTIDAVFNGYDEKYVFPRSRLVARCKVRTRNGANYESEWAMSKSVKLYNLFQPPLADEKANAEPIEFRNRLRNNHMQL